MSAANSGPETARKGVASRVTLESIIAELEEAHKCACKAGQRRTAARAKRLSEQFRAQLRLKGLVNGATNR